MMAFGKTSAFNVLKEKFINLAESYFTQKFEKTDDSHADYQFFKMILLNEVEEPDNDKFLVFRDSVTEANRYPLYPLYQTLSMNLVKWIVYNENDKFNVKLENVNNISVDFTTEFFVSIDKLKMVLPLILKFTDEECPSMLDNQYGDQMLVSRLDEKISPEVSSVSLCLLPIVGNSSETLIVPDLTIIDSYVINIYQNLHKSDILKFLGISKTVGSVELLPPPLWRLWESYCKIHHPKSKLSVGARALSKHCHRSADSWWGNCTGTEQDKNCHALKVLERIFLSISWMNIHTLPHNTFVLELRCEQGYGLRWSHDGTFFRGFLEPQMIDGHEKNWRH